MTLGLNFQETGSGKPVSAFCWREQMTEKVSNFLDECEQIRAHHVDGGTLVLYPVEHAPMRLHFNDWLVVWPDGFIEHVEDVDFREFFEQRLHREDLMRALAEEEDAQLAEIDAQEMKIGDFVMFSGKSSKEHLAIVRDRS